MTLDSIRVFTYSDVSIVTRSREGNGHRPILVHDGQVRDGAGREGVRYQDRAVSAAAIGGHVTFVVSVVHGTHGEEVLHADGHVEDADLQGDGVAGGQGIEAGAGEEHVLSDLIAEVEVARVQGFEKEADVVEFR